MLGVGVIGAGYWAQNMLRVISDHPRSQLLHICDLDDKARAAAGLRYPSARTSTSVDDMLSDTAVDVVYIATPPATHASLASDAIRAGKHVLVEKPMTTSANEAGDLIEMASINNRTLMVGHTFLFSPPVLKVKELITSGHMGEIFYLESQRVNLGKYQESGVLWDLAPHDLSIICYWLDEAPVAVSASGRSFVSTRREDVVFLTLEFASGAIAQVHVSWLAPVKLRRTTVSGSKRMAIYDDTAGPEAVRIYDHGVDRGAPETFGEFQLSYRQGDVWMPRLESTEPLRSEWDHFLTSVEQSSPPRSSGTSGAWVVHILEAAERSLRSGRREPIVAEQVRQRPASRPRFQVRPEDAHDAAKDLAR